MSTLHMTAASVPATDSTAAGPGLLARAFDAWARYQARVARSHVDQQLKRFTDEELREMGYGNIDVARIRHASEGAPQHWL